MLLPNNCFVFAKTSPTNQKVNYATILVIHSIALLIAISANKCSAKQLSSSSNGQAQQQLLPPRSGAGHAAIGESERRADFQMPDSIYKTAPLLFGADIMSDYFNEPKTIARKSGGGGGGSGRAAPTPAATTKKEQQNNKPRQQQKPAVDLPLMSPKQMTRMRMLANTGNSESVSAPQVGASKLSSPVRAAKLERLREGLAESASGQVEVGATKTAATARQQPSVPSSPSSGQSSSSDDEVEAAVNAMQTDEDSDNNMFMSQSNSALQPDADDQQQQTMPAATTAGATPSPAPAATSTTTAPSVSMDQVLSSLGLVVEAMKQQTMAMQMISGRMAAEQTNTGGNQMASSLPEPPAQQLPAQLSTSSSSAASQAEARALLESFGELMSGFRSSRSTKQLLDSFGESGSAETLSAGGGGSTKGGPEPMQQEQQPPTKGGAEVPPPPSRAATIATTTTITTTAAPTTTAPTTTTTPPTTTTTPAPTTRKSTIKPHTTTTTTVAPYEDTMSPVIAQMIAHQKKMAPVVSASSSYSPLSPTGPKAGGWRQVKPFDYYPISSHSIAQDQLEAFEAPPAKMSVSMNYQGGQQQQLLPMRHQRNKQPLSLMLGENPQSVSMNYQPILGGGGGGGSGMEQPMPAADDEQMMTMNQVQQHYNNQAMMMQHLMRQPAALQHNMEHNMEHAMLEMAAPPVQQHRPQMVSPYKQPKMMANMVANAVAAATAAEQQQALEQSLQAAMQQEAAAGNEMSPATAQQGGGGGEQSLSDELPRVPGRVAQQQQQQQTMLAAAPAATKSAAGAMRAMQAAVAQAMAAALPAAKLSGALKIGERPPFDPQNFQVLGPVEVGQRKQQQQMAEMVKNAVKEAVQQQQQKDSSSASATKTVAADLNETASESVKSSTKEVGVAEADLTAAQQQQQQRPQQQQQLVAVRPPQAPISSKVTSFSILGGRFRLTPHTQMLHAILEPSKALIKHALGEFMPVGQAPQQVQLAAPAKARGRKTRRPSAKSTQPAAATQKGAKATQANRMSGGASSGAAATTTGQKTSSAAKKSKVVVASQERASK